MRNCIIKRDEKGNVKVYNSILMKKAEQERLNFQIIGEKGASNVKEYYQKLETAKSMERQGYTPTEISNKTSWIKSVDGWKMFSKDILDAFQIKNKQENTKLKLNQVIGNENILFKSYPNISDITVVFYNENARNIPQEIQEFGKNRSSYYSVPSKTIVIRTDISENEFSHRSVLAHEVLHALQREEGFSNGGNLQTVLDETVKNLNIDATNITLDKLRDEIKKADKSKLNKEQQKLANSSLETIDAIINGNKAVLYNQYKHILGEIDASIVTEIANGRLDNNLSYQELLQAYSLSNNIQSENIFVVKDNNNELKFQIIGEKGASKIEEYNNLLNQAKLMEKQGRSFGEISDATGWYKGQDGWKMISKEIVEQFKIKDYKINDVQQLQEVLGAENKLFKAYPNLKNQKVIFIDENSRNIPQEFQNIREDLLGVYKERLETIVIRPKRILQQGNKETLESVLAHEVVHAISRIENFSKGGGLNSILDETIKILGVDMKQGLSLFDLYSKIENADKSKLNENQKKVVQDSLQTIEDIANETTKIRENQYNHILGEIDASIITNLVNKTDSTVNYKELYNLHINRAGIDPKNIYVLESNNGIQFQIIGEKGARNLDQVEEATFRMDNLRVAKEMEAKGKTPKEIRLATGWEKAGIENTFTSLSVEQKIKFLLEKGDLKIGEC